MKDLTIYIKKGETIPSKVFASIKAYLQMTEKDEFELVCRPVKSKRNASQNNLLFGAVYPAIVRASKGYGDGRYDNWTKIDFHEALAEHYLRELNEKTGVIRTRSTASLSVKEFSEYIQKLIDEILIDKFNGYLEDKYRDEYEISMGLKSEKML